jgi:hypothetical protein
MWNPVSVHSDAVLVSVQDNRAQVEARFSLFEDIANLDARSVHGLHRTCHGLRNSFGRTRWNSYVMWVLWNLVLVRLETVSVSVQDRC